MRFEPPRCPYPPCRSHFHPAAGFCVRRGWYRPRCRTERVPRFRCNSCRRTFSRQTFRHDFRDKRPLSNGPLFQLLASGVSLRQAARIVGLDIRAVCQKLAKSGNTCLALLDNLASRLPAGRRLALDALTTSEGAAWRILTVPIVVDRDSTFVLAYAAAAACRRPPNGVAVPGRAAPATVQRLRTPGARACLDRVVATVAAKLPGDAPVLVHTPAGATCAHALRRHFGARLAHVPEAGMATNERAHPLAPIRRTIAMARDNCARLRRHSWSGSKKRGALISQLHLFAAYVNLQRRRFHRDPAHHTPARALGLLPRSLTSEEILGWRQDWGERSSHPLDASGRRRIDGPGPA